MFAVELTPPELDAVKAAFGVSPALLYDPWRGYTGMCVWEVNRGRTYSLPGEPEDDRWQGTMTLSNVSERRAMLYNMLDPETRRGHAERWQRSADYDSETLLGYAKIVARNP